MAINAEDVIAGYYVDTTARFHGFLLDRGSFTTVDPPGSIKTGTMMSLESCEAAGKTCR